MQVLVKLFGGVREAVGEKELSVTLPEGASVAELRALLARERQLRRGDAHDRIEQGVEVRQLVAVGARMRESLDVAHDRGGPIDPFHRFFDELPALLDPLRSFDVGRVSGRARCELRPEVA